MIRFEIVGQPFRYSCALATVVLLLVVSSAPSQAQAPRQPPPPPPGGAPQTAPASDQPATMNADRREDSGDDLSIFRGHFEYTQGDTKIYADTANYYPKTHRLLLNGNVVLAQTDNRISADRADFNVDTKLGTFYNAYGIGSVKPPKQQQRPGGPVLAPVSNQPTDVYFFGDTVEKIGPRKYRITNGGFSPCVQPTPRWELSAGTMLLNVDHYTVLRNAVLTVKGVPMLYLPIMVYPTKKDDRATGFLLPTYGSSTLRGQQIHNAFFWAIDRSQDATIEHEWYSKVGQGVAGEYRYNFGGGDTGNLSAHFLDQHSTTYTLDDGTSSSVGASKSYDLRGSLSQTLPGNFRATANVGYFSDLTVNQTYNTNILDASSNERTYGVNIAGALAGYTISGTVNRSEYFSDATDSSVRGGDPQIDISRNEKPLFGSDLYFAIQGEYNRILNETKGIDTSTGEPLPFDFDQGLSRIDITPQIRYPFKKWQWFTVNSTFSWRDTYYSRRQDSVVVTPTVENPAGITLIDQGLNRDFFTAQAQITGPVFERIWDTPNNGYAEKFKHSVEPYLNVSRTSAIDNYAEIIKFDQTDSIVGSTTQLTYGVTNRFFAKRKTTPGRPAVSNEILDVQIEQTYYSQPLAATVDPQYSTSFTSVDSSAQSNFSPIALTVRAIPTNEFNASVRAEFDSRYHKLRTITATGTYTINGLLTTNVQWTKKGYIPELAGFNDPTQLDHYISATTNVHTRDNQYGTAYQFNFDVLNSSMLQQQISGYYNAQCCGIAFQYQTQTYPGNIYPADRRFFLSFTLAGLGNFSPFNGAMSGMPH